MKKRKKVNTNKLMGILFFSLLLVLGTCFFLKSDFFYLNEIVINNNKYLTKEEINNLLNIEKNKNIFFYNLNNLQNKIKESPYIKNCEIKRKIPNKLIVNIEEKNIVGPIYNGRSYVYIDDDGNFIGQIKKIKNNETVIYSLYTLDNSFLRFTNKNDKKSLLVLYSKLKEENILKQIKTIDFRNKSIINMKGKSGITICLNKDNSIKQNIIKLRKVLVDLQNRKETDGNIDMTYNDYILYSPYKN
ncbi:cell division protein FtsQ/DivIB [Terrisporobacter sp.]